MLLCFHTLLIPLTSMIVIFEDSVDKINQSDSDSTDDAEKWHRFTMSKGKESLSLVHKCIVTELNAEIGALRAW